MPSSKLIPILAIVVAGCTTAPSPDASPLAVPGISPLPDLEIAFFEAEDRLGFVDPTGSKYASYPVDLSDWYQTPGAVTTMMDYVTWDPSGTFLVAGYTGRHRSSSWPLLLTHAGDLHGCPPETSPYAPYRIWSIGEARLVAVDQIAEEHKVVVFDIESCRILDTLYSVRDGTKEAISEAALSSQGRLALDRVTWGEGDPKDELLIIDQDGIVVASIPDGGFPAWSRDGEWVAFHISGDGLYVARKDGSDKRQVVGGLERRTFPSWSPDGKWLVYDRTETGADGRGTSIIYKVSVDTGEQVEVHRGGQNPNWRW